METIVERPAALDVHKAQVTACARVPDRQGRREQHIAEFATTVRGLLDLRDWLAGHGVTQVVMEATGVYWKAPWAILEDEFDCMLVNARHVKQVPGRKTDVSDAAWLCQLAEAGLLKASFVPPRPVRQLRNLTRYRKTQIQERSREVNRLHKALEDAGIKLDCVAADVMGKSGRDMLDALVAGTTDPGVLAELARRQMRKKIPQLREALEGHSTSTTRCGSGRSSRTSTSSTSRSSGSPTRSRNRSALSRRPLSCSVRSSASSAAARNASSPRSAPTCRAFRRRGTWPRGPASAPA